MRNYRFRAIVFGVFLAVSANQICMAKTLRADKHDKNSGTSDVQSKDPISPLLRDIGDAGTASPTESEVDAYLSAFSVAQGESILLFASTSLTYWHARVSRMSKTGRDIKAIYTNIPGTLQSVPDEAFAQCCDWQTPLVIDIGEDWESGLYQIQISTDAGAFPYKLPLLHTFVVKENVPGSRSQILVLDTAPNQIAYNRWGGASSYWHMSPSLNRAEVLSTRRPGNFFYQWQEERFARWADAMGIATEYASMMDIEYTPDLLSAYQTVVIVAHSEYWSRNQRDALDDFIAGGGNLIVLGGNAMWWQVRFEQNQMLIYKVPELDPLYGSRNDLVTGLWHAEPVNDPEERTIGLSFRFGGMVNNIQGFMPAIEGNGGYTATDADHRMLSGTGLANGSLFGRESGIVGYEVDGVEFEWIDGKATPLGTGATPPGLEILAIAPADTGSWQGFGTVATFSRGNGAGRVFNGASIDWSSGLWDFATRTIGDPSTHKIMLNVLAELQPDSAAHCTNALPGIDYDSDSIIDACDNCIAIANANQLDANGNGTGDACENKARVNIEVDIKPADSSNGIDLDTETELPVTLISSTRGSSGPLEFDASRIDAASLRLFPGEAAVNETPPQIADTRGDNRADLTVSFDLEDLDFSCGGSTLAIIEGQTIDGQMFEGMQKITTADCAQGVCHP